MDVLGILLSQAEEAGLLQHLSRTTIPHQISMYADDVALFLHPTAVDISITLDILHLFGEASGLHNNENKSNVYPIQCSDEDIMVVQNLLPCELSTFPCHYLGLPLSIYKLTKDQVQPIVDKIAAQLPNWKADLLTWACRRIQVQHVLTGMIIYLAMAIDFPSWALDAIDKIKKGFIWRGHKEANGGHCLLCWGRVCRPLKMGGLGISNLHARF
jgi:hypothetical protein